MLSTNHYLFESGTDKCVVEPSRAECAASSTETSGSTFFAHEMG